MKLIFFECQHADRITETVILQLAANYRC